MDYQVNDSWKSRENTHNFFFCFAEYLTKSLTDLQAMARDKKSYFSMLLLLLLAVCFVGKSQIHSRRAWHIQHNASLLLLFVVLALSCAKKTHIQSNIIQTYSRTETYVLNNRQKHVFATPAIPFTRNDDNFTNNWLIFFSFVVGLFVSCMNVTATATVNMNCVCALFHADIVYWKWNFNR